MSEYPFRVTLFDDGVYRWSYDLDMWRNRFLLKLILKIISLIFALPLLFLTGMVAWRALPMLMRGVSRERILFAVDSDLGFLAFVCLLWIGMLLLALILYAICAAAMKGRYRLRFQMDESAVALIQSDRSKDTVNALGAVAAVAALATGKPGGALRVGSILAVNASAGTTPFSSVTKVRLHPECDVVHLQQWFGMNQIYVNPEDYPFVRDFILSRVREKARRNAS